MHKYSKHARQNGKDEITNQLRDLQKDEEKTISCDIEAIAKDETHHFCLVKDHEKEMIQKYDDLFDERFEYYDNPWLYQ